MEVVVPGPVREIDRAWRIKLIADKNWLGKAAD